MHEPPLAPLASLPPIPPATFRRENEPVASGREKLGLIAGLALLALAVAVLFVKMNNEDEPMATPPPRGSAPVATPPLASTEPAVPEEAIMEDAPVLELDASAPKRPDAPPPRPAHRRTYPAAQPALMPRKAPPNPYAPAPK